MTYTPKTWTNDVSPYLSGANLNVIEAGIVSAHQLVGANVKDVHPGQSRGALGDGTTDDTAQIQAAITAAGVGGVVFFPKSSGSYRVSSSLKPLERQTWIGQHSPRYWWNTSTLGSSCALQATSSFTGSALIHNTATAVAGVTIRNLGLYGNGEDGTLNGIDFGPASGSERMWKIEACTLMQFKTAICGFGWVVTIRDCHISRNGYGISPHRGADSTSRFNDSMITNNYLYFNYRHALEFAGSVESGLCTIIGNRFERSGVGGMTASTYDPNATSRDATACGIYMSRAHAINIVGNTSDANAGPGLKLVNVNPSSAGSVNNINSTGNVWKRDGIGTNSGSDQLPGIHLDGVVYSSFNDMITYGDPDDGATNTALIVPKQGVLFTGTYACEQVILRGSIQLYANTTTAGVVTTTAPWQTIIDIPRQAKRVTEVEPKATAPDAPRAGTLWWDTAAGVLKVYSGTAWRTVATV